ncbi:MAG: hypothetical protein COU29_03400 [Candidatus Magasanikbacteria bacterium CG10_big_fil_rev_8_21_14_0_10_36_32]|uniref:SIS domain-containing protein n=1 Tax=Candidatus Magasanikbacteria bacterium CG10_big_fil_rev_8_21_14_0_10_36_32 TaxID=1974646 RepID=A0A2M6W684_9BACT|nr:MAG: hypothetical protein COU29_03400 [Candidatus Magasanikbacteria bacterium CG10_big_fil_rev_8_21_14_0_10_36_32]
MDTQILDNLTEIRKLDVKNMLGSLESLSKQAEEVAQAAAELNLPTDYKNIQRVVFLGMGGSTLGAHIIKYLFREEMLVILDIVNDYHIPAYVDDKTLVVVSSYSGGTEEPLAAMEEAMSKKAKLVIITAGGKLAEQSRDLKIPAIVFTTKNNPCNSPRMGLGYSVFGQIILLSKIGVLKINQEEIDKAVQTIENYNGIFGVVNAQADNPAKSIAVAIGDRSVWCVGAEHLSANAHVVANQINENAKRMAGYYLIPELNHHLMEGMIFPKNNPQNIIFILLESVLYDERVIKRYEVTKTVLDKNKIGYVSYQCQGKDKFSQVCEMLVLSGYLSFYLAMLEGIDPTAIPFVDYFKQQLKK